MCRNIKTLRPPYAEPTPEDVRNAALQYVRKISGFRKPSQANAEVFELAVEEITDASARLLGSLVVQAPGGRRRATASPRSE
jgi:hypothetical protein